MPANDDGFPDGARTAAQALIALPGTGSDAVFIQRAFGPICAALDIELIALDPGDDLIAEHRSHLADTAAAYERVLVGGVSIGAALALEWALTAHPEHCAGVWAALPAWSGPASAALAAASAAATAAALRRDGLESTVASMAQSSPPWLAAELTRSWRALYPGLIDQLEQASRYAAPTVAEIGSLRVPLSLVAAPDDPLHPLVVAQQWAAAAPSSQLSCVALSDWGQQPTLLGQMCARGWASLVGQERSAGEATP